MGEKDGGVGASEQEQYVPRPPHPLLRPLQEQQQDANMNGARN